MSLDENSNKKSFNDKLKELKEKGKENVEKKFKKDKKKKESEMVPFSRLVKTF